MHATAPYLGHPDWSPDGRSMVFTQFSAPATPTFPRGSLPRIFVTGEDGSTRRLIPEAVSPSTPDYHDLDVSWSRVRD